MSFILDGLYLGGFEDACQQIKLQSNGITHILTIDIKPLPIENCQGFKCKYVHALDMDDFDLIDHFNECIQFIAEGRKEGGILVHCHVGQSRSATILIAYLMDKMSMNMEDSLTMVRCQRPQIRPNPGFLEQLELFEEMCNTVNFDSQCYKQYKMRNLAKQVQMAQTDGLLQNLSNDPIQGLNPEDVFYKCKKCRRVLFKKTSVMSHNEGRGQAAFTWQKKITTADSQELDSPPCVGKSLFIEPVQWMGEGILQNEGKIFCPKCTSKLGSFKWTGENCPCGTWVTPAFHIQTSKVDQAKQPPKMVANPGSSVHRPLPKGLLLQGPEETPVTTSSEKDAISNTTDSKASTTLYLQQTVQGQARLKSLITK